ncbi:MAG: hypothetical protein ACLGHN_00365 [Bacteriovoracia bacterium]
MITMALLVGIWTTACIQTQMSHSAGYVKESYSINIQGDFEFKREWFKDFSCTEPDGTDTETGTVELGEKISSFFMPGETYEADFNTQKGVDLGAISIKQDHLKIARGVKNSSIRNTMLSLFEYKKN